MTHNHVDSFMGFFSPAPLFEENLMKTNHYIYNWYCMGMSYEQIQNANKTCYENEIMESRFLEGYHSYYDTYDVEVFQRNDNK